MRVPFTDLKNRGKIWKEKNIRNVEKFNRVIWNQKGIIRNALFMHTGCFTRGSAPCIWHRIILKLKQTPSPLSFLLSLSLCSDIILILSLSLFSFSPSFSLVVSVSMRKVRCACIHRDAMPWLGTAWKQLVQTQQISVITSYAYMISAENERWTSK